MLRTGLSLISIFKVSFHKETCLEKLKNNQKLKNRKLKRIMIGHNTTSCHISYFWEVARVAHT